MLEALVTKISGKKNAKHDENFRSCFIALTAFGNKQAFEFISGNVGQHMTLCHEKDASLLAHHLHLLNLRIEILLRKLK